MTRNIHRSHPGILRMIPRVALLTAVLFAPLIAMQSVEAASSSILEDTYSPPGNAGLVIIASLTR